jgi:hypothetical protein
LSRFEHPHIPFDPFSFKNYDKDPEIIHIYQRGKIAQDPFVQFLSFYQILEFYFLSYAERALRDEVQQKLIEMDSPITSDKIVDILRQIKKDPRKNKDEDLFKNLLRSLGESGFIQETQVLDFINRYETLIGNHIYIKTRKIFDQQISGVDVRTGNVLSSIASRTIKIRNSLVHSSDKYDQEGRYVPKAEHDKQLELEIPLIDFLTKLIISAPWCQWRSKSVQ